MFDIIQALFVGLIIGGVARLLLPGKQPIGCLWTMLVGAASAVVGTLIAKAAGLTTGEGFSFLELVIQVVVAMLAVGGLTAIKAKK